MRGERVKRLTRTRRSSVTFSNATGTIPPVDKGPVWKMHLPTFHVLYNPDDSQPGVPLASIQKLNQAVLDIRQVIHEISMARMTCSDGTRREVDCVEVASAMTLDSGATMRITDTAGRTVEYGIERFNASTLCFDITRRRHKLVKVMAAVNEVEALMHDMIGPLFCTV